MESLLSRRDLDFQLYEVLDTEALCQRPRYAEHRVETFTAMLDAAEQLAVRHFLPHWKAVDEDEAHFGGTGVQVHPGVAPALRALVDAGFLAAGHDVDLGGLQLPSVIEKACFGYFQAANPSTAWYPLLTRAGANLILSAGSADQIERFAKPMVAGRFFGTVAFTEMKAGSVLAVTGSGAVLDGDGSYRVFGSKMRITAGDHDLAENIIHLVLARIEGAPVGAEGRSLFIVPKFLVRDDGTVGDRNDVSVVGINHRMGCRGTVEAVVSLGDGRHQPLGAPVAWWTS